MEQGDSTEYGTLAVWSTAGDPNADGEVTAEDVNADGFVGADDAAAVLCYAAAQGSGNPLSWIDILRK